MFLRAVCRRVYSTNTKGQSPPRLPEKDQTEFERLQNFSRGAFSNTAANPSIHPDLRQKPQPEFDGEKNPKTGEIGGPKTDPLRHGDYSFGGRCTDF